MSPLWLSGPRRPPPAWVSCSCVHRAHPPRFTSRVPTDPSGSGGPGHSHDRSRHAFLFAVLFYIPASTRRSQQNPRRRASFPNLIVVKWHFHFALTFFFFLISTFISLLTIQGFPLVTHLITPAAQSRLSGGNVEFRGLRTRPRPPAVCHFASLRLS